MSLMLLLRTSRPAVPLQRSEPGEATDAEATADGEHPPGAMLGEVTPEIVQAILGARATKVLLPLNRARVEIVGAEVCTLEMLITQSLSRVRSLVNSIESV